MSKCNIFKPLASNTGEFLTFQQYTDDITRSLAEGNNYRVVPSRFVALDLKVADLFDPEKTTLKLSLNGPTVNKPCLFFESDHEVTDPNIIIPQILQSHYENSVAVAREVAEQDPLFAGKFKDTGREMTTELLWSTLIKYGLITPATMEGDENFRYFNEVQYVGDINIHSNRNVDTYNYNEIYCYIPTGADNRYYMIEHPYEPTTFPGTPIPEEQYIQGWTPASYPIRYPLMPQVLMDPASISGAENAGTYGVGTDILACLYDEDAAVVNRHNELDRNVEFKFNAIVVFYDIYNNPLNSDELNKIHSNRPMGIYFTGPVEYADDGTVIGLKNTVTKYITNGDAYGQGSSFGLRVMNRFVPTPNSSSYTFASSVVLENGEDNQYTTLAQSMGKIADAITEMNRSYKSSRDIAQEYKDHLALFRNNRTNVPYAREVNGEMYWFVNGRNTGQKCNNEIRPEEAHNTLPNWHAILPRESDYETPEAFAEAMEAWVTTHGCRTKDRYNGWAMVEKEDINPYSDTYGMVRTFMEWDEKWLEFNEPIVFDEPIWELREENPITRMSAKNHIVYTGYAEFIYDNKATNPNPEYMTKTETKASVVYPASDIAPKWEEVSRSCELTNGLRNGNLVLREKDGNIYSDTYTEERVRKVFDPEACPVESEEFNVTINYKQGLGTVSGAGKYKKGEVALLHAEPAENVEFIRWECNGILRTENPLYVTVEKNLDVKAVFAEIEEPQYTVVVKFNKSVVSVDRSGMVVEPNNAFKFPESGYKAEDLIYTAKPADDYLVEGWNINNFRATYDETLKLTKEQLTPGISTIIEPVWRRQAMDAYEFFVKDGVLSIRNTKTLREVKIEEIREEGSVIILDAPRLAELGNVILSYTDFDGSKTGEQYIMKDGIYPDFNPETQRIESIIEAKGINGDNTGEAIYKVTPIVKPETQDNITARYLTHTEKWWVI